MVDNFLVELGIGYPVKTSKYNNFLIIDPITDCHRSKDSSKYVDSDGISIYTSTLSRTWLLWLYKLSQTVGRNPVLKML